MHPKIRLLLNWLIDGVVSIPRTSDARGGVLCVRLDAIGDFVLWLREAALLRGAFPDSRITLAANSTWAPLARELPYWDEVIAIEVAQFATTFGNRWRSLRLIRRSEFAVAVQPTYSRTFAADSLVRATRAPRRIASQGDCTNQSPRQKRISDQWYTELMPVDAGDTSEIDRNRTFMRQLAGTPTAHRAFLLPLLTPLPSHLRPAPPYFIVVPGASWAGKRWPSSSFAGVIDALQRDLRCRAVVCGSAQERALCAEVASLCADVPVNFAGRTSLSQFCELVRDARLVVANDTSAVHIAAAVGAPSVCLLGGGHFGRFLPYPATDTVVHPEVVFRPMPCFGCNWVCTQPHKVGKAVPCISAISVDDVVAAAARLQRTDRDRPENTDPTTLAAVRRVGGRRTRGDAKPPPRITVITVVRNGRATLLDTIASVLSQQGDDLEYIVIDGASTDGTLDIIRDHDSQLDYWVSEPDSGIYDAMNKALSAARGDWLMFLGADDQLKPVLRDIASELIDRDAVYYGDVEIAATGAVSGGKFNRYRLMQENICHQAIFYPRRVYQATRYDTGIGPLADHCYNIELRGAGVPFVHIPKVISRFNNCGISSVKDPRFEAIKLEAIRRNFGTPLYLLKRLRTTLVHLLKPRHVAT